MDSHGGEKKKKESVEMNFQFYQFDLYYNMPL